MLSATDAEQVLRLLPEPALVVTPKGDLVIANGAAEYLLANAGQEAGLLDCVHPSPGPFLEYLRQCSNTRALLPGTVSLKQPHGVVVLRTHGGLLRPPGNGEPAQVLLRFLPDDGATEASLLSRTIRELSDEIRHRRQTYAILEETLREKDMLLRELHHRVNNSLQMLISMISIMRRDAADFEVTAALDKIGGRLTALATLQRLMYRSAQHEEIPGKKFIEDLTRAVIGGSAPEATVSVDVADVSLSTDVAFPLALAFNELLLNAVKYGLRSGKGSIGVRLRSSASGIELAVGDDGPGLPPMIEGPVRRSSGLEIVKGLCRQAAASWDVETDNGTRWILRFPQSARGKSCH